MSRKKIILGSTIAGVLLLGVTTYAISWSVAANEWQESYENAVAAHTDFVKDNKIYNDTAKNIKDDDLTQDGKIIKADLLTITGKDDQYADQLAQATHDKPSWTNDTPWSIRSQADELDSLTTSMKTSMSAMNQDVIKVKAEKAKQNVIKAKTHLLSKLKDAEKLYNDSNGAVDDEMSRKTLKGWIDKTSSLLKSKTINNERIYTMRSDETKSLFDAVNKAVRSRTDRINEEAALDALRQAADQTAGDVYSTDAGQGALVYQAQQPSYGNTSYYQPQTVGSNLQPTSPGYSSAVNATCSVPNEATTNTCQGAVDQGGMVDISYYNGSTHVYSQHNGTGGAWINNLKPGDSVSFGGKEYTVNDYDQQNTQLVPYEGIYAQTCNENGNHLVGLTPKR